MAQVRRSPAGPAGAGTTCRLRQRFMSRRLDVVLAVTRHEPERVITGEGHLQQIRVDDGHAAGRAAGGATRLTFVALGTP